MNGCVVMSTSKYLLILDPQFIVTYEQECKKTRELFYTEILIIPQMMPTAQCWMVFVIEK